MKYIITTLIFLLLNTTLFSQDYCSGEITFYELENAIKTPEKVINLDIAMQKLTSVSSDIGKLKELKCLDLSFNKISDLPEEFKNLTKLEFINLSGTRHLAKLPEVLKELTSLKAINLADHPEWSVKTFDDAQKMLPNVEIIK